MLFADNLVLVGENKEELNQRLFELKLSLERKGLRINRNKTEYIKYEFDEREQFDEMWSINDSKQGRGK